MRKHKDTTAATASCAKHLMMLLDSRRSILEPGKHDGKRIRQIFNRAQKANGDHYRLK